MEGFSVEEHSCEKIGGQNHTTVVKWEYSCFSTQAENGPVRKTSSAFDRSCLEGISSCLGRLLTESF